MHDSTSRSNGGISFSGALFLLFLALKLTGHIGWSWWWVTAPLWAPLALLLLILAAVVPILYFSEKNK